MQRFIDKKAYVYCGTQEESLQFREICYQYNLPFTKRWNLEKQIDDPKDGAKLTFALDWDNAWIPRGERDGISAWQNDYYADRRLPIVDFCDLVFENSINNFDAADFLSLL